MADHPYHSDDAFMEAEPVQSFVGTAYEPTPEEAEQFRLGRLAVRKPDPPADTPPDGEPPIGSQ